MQTFQQISSLTEKSLSSFEQTTANAIFTKIKARHGTLTAKWVVIDGRLTCR